MTLGLFSNTTGYDRCSFQLDGSSEPSLSFTQAFSNWVVRLAG
jgi:hypothetical protein